jgi:trehalose 6-phosphate synthase
MSIVGDSVSAIVLSDRGPVRFTDEAGMLVPRTQSGSVTALLGRLAAAANYPITWFSPSTSPADELATRRGLFDALDHCLGYSPRVVTFQESLYDKYYYDVGVNIIWGAWHGIEDDVPLQLDRSAPARSLEPYFRVNRVMARRVADTARSEAVVAVQDYQFMLVPELLRRRRPDLSIVHFSHVPFPNAESVARLPGAVISTLVHGMLGADLLGFQRPAWAERFLDCCEHLRIPVDRKYGRVSYRGRWSWIRCYPVSVDVNALIRRSCTPEVRRWEIDATEPESCVRIVRVDRLDPAKNALRGFQALATVLDRNPTLAAKVRFVACFIPSRERVPAYQQYASAVRALIEDVNRRHPGAITVHYGNDQGRALAMLCRYDVLLVNSVADGMNLVALEGAVLNARDGVVVLSTGTGAYDALPGALALERPRDVGATAEVLEAALALSPADRRRRAVQMREATVKAGVVHWLDDQIADAVRASHGDAPSSQPP